MLFTELIEKCEKLILGNYSKTWPLTKILDIGGEKVKTSFGSFEIPPIPCHVHAGDVINGKL